MATVLMMAAFAGVLIIADDEVMADDAPVADTVTYKVTYVYGDNVRVVTSTSATVSFLTFSEAFSTSAPEGYGFDKWKVGSSLYAEGGSIEVTGDITVEPTFKVAADKAVVILKDGNKTSQFTLSTTSSGTGPATYTAVAPTKDEVSPALNALGLNYAIGSDNKTVSIAKDGFKFEGFLMNASASGEVRYSYDLTALVGTAGKEVTYELVFTPIYNITFIVEGATILEITNDTIVLNDVKDSAGAVTAPRTVPVAPVKENYIFMGWYDAVGEKIIGYSVDKDEYTYATDDFQFASGTVLYAKFIPLTYTVTFVYGDDKAVFTTETVKYGEKAVEPKGLPEGYKGWDFDFAEAILADTEIVAIPADPVTIYTVTFEIDGKAPVYQKSDSMVLPDTAVDGKVFQGWVVKGESQYVDPMKYDIESDITFVAVYKTADPPAGPGFFETNEGKCVAVIIGVILIAFVYAVYTNMFGMKDFLTSFKVQRVKKE